jgi:hypothetical protein
MAKRTYAKTLSLAELNVRVNQTEQALGPMDKMGRTDEKSGFNFAGGSPPDTAVRIVQKVAGSANQPPASTRICEGQLWSASVKIDAVAYRL